MISLISALYIVLPDSAASLIASSLAYYSMLMIGLFYLVENSVSVAIIASDLREFIQ